MQLPPSASSIWSKVIPLTREELASADAVMARARQAERAADAEGERGDEDGPDSGATAGGGGPNGERLYNADWYRRPTHAELSAYLPAGAPRIGWGMVACQTVAGYRVENCHEIGQSPAGSGLAGGGAAGGLAVPGCCRRGSAGGRWSGPGCGSGSTGPESGDIR